MPFFAKKKPDGSMEPMAAPAEPVDEDLVSVTRRRDQALKRLGEIQFSAQTGGSVDRDALDKCIKEIQFLEEQVKLIYNRRLQNPPATGDLCACGAPLNPGEAFCRNCGSRHSSTGTQKTMVPPTPPGMCPVCRHKLKPGSQFCASCGAKVGAPLAAGQPQPGAGGAAARGSVPSRAFGFQMSAPVAHNGMRDAGLGDWHEGNAPAPGFAAQAPQMPPPFPPNPQIQKQWGRHLEEIVNPLPADPSVYLRRGITLARENQLIEATEQFEQASKLAPRDPMPRYHMGLVRYRMGDLDGAIGEFERALRINPNFPDAHNDLGLVLTKKGQVREAIHHFRKALQIQPQHPDAHYNLGYACLAMGDPVGASTHLDLYLRIAPNAPDARAVGEMLHRLRQQGGVTP